MVGGINLYPYVGNNPVNWGDPSGLLTGAEALPWAGGYGGASGWTGAAGAGAAGWTIGLGGVALLDWYFLKELEKIQDKAIPKEKCKEDRECGPDTRGTALAKAMGWSFFSPDWWPIPWNQYRGKGGPNYSFVRSSGVDYYGYRDPNSRGAIQEHPDGHPDQVGPGYPDHHKCPHFHAISPTGREWYFQYMRGII